MLAGFVTSFVTAAVELSATIMLVTKDSQAPMSYGIYLYMQSAAGRGPGGGGRGPARAARRVPRPARGANPGDAGHHPVTPTAPGSGAVG
ncbi:hypothetical protein G6F50_018575 [Rhizopus delemar]|uniref:Autophagy-related protein n=1 Tax=Rhizopus delemar TaxID=936053 RepID=A0A9P6XMB8_9FUNG|nr:hypothetical protein G6F50_018575 [Rhizopus delemar]